MNNAKPAYDPDNIFAKILRGEMPCHKVYEDDHTVAFLDIMPRADGHTLVVPKRPSRNILDATPEDLAHVMSTVQTIARAGMSAFDADGVTVQHFCESAGGQIIFHTHFHVLPRHDGIALRPPGNRAPDEVLQEHAEKLRAALRQR